MVDQSRSASLHPGLEKGSVASPLDTPNTRLRGFAPLKGRGCLRFLPAPWLKNSAPASHRAAPGIREIPPTGDHK